MSSAVLAQLLAQGAGEGADLATLRAIVEEAGELAASRAMARLGLDDAAAAKGETDMGPICAYLEEIIDDGGFLVGDSLTLADC